MLSLRSSLGVDVDVLRDAGQSARLIPGQGDPFPLIVVRAVGPQTDLRCNLDRKVTYGLLKAVDKELYGKIGNVDQQGFLVLFKLVILNFFGVVVSWVVD